MLKKLSIADLYIGLWAATRFLSAYRPGRIPALMLFVLLLISAYYAIYVNFRLRRNLYVKALNLLIIMFSIYGFIEILFPVYREGKPYVFLQHIYESLLPIYAFYVLSLTNKITEKTLRIWAPIILFMTIVTFSVKEASLLRDINREEVVNNASYSVLAIFPLLFLFHKKPALFYIGVLISFYFILSGVKRGAIFLATICVILTLFRIVRDTNNRIKPWSLLLTVATVFLMIYLIRYLMDHSALFSLRYELTMSGDDSGRSDIWSKLLNYFANEANFFQILFGIGIFGTRLVAGLPAHNDWLEILTGEGLIGVLVYLYYWIVLYKTWQKKPLGGDMKFMMLLCLVVLFGRSLFSMSFDNTYYPSSLALGFCLANDEMHNEDSRL